jgi:hypothetical protein
MTIMQVTTATLAFHIVVPGLTLASVPDHSHRKSCYGAANPNRTMDCPVKLGTNDECAPGSDWEETKWGRPSR